MVGFRIPTVLMYTLKPRYTTFFVPVQEHFFIVSRLYFKGSKIMSFFVLHLVNFQIYFLLCLTKNQHLLQVICIQSGMTYIEKFCIEGWGWARAPKWLLPERRNFLDRLVIMVIMVIKVIKRVKIVQNHKFGNLVHFCCCWLAAKGQSYKGKTWIFLPVIYKL